MSIQEYIFNLGLESIADEMHKHPISGSDWSIRGLLEVYKKRCMPNMFHEFINSSSDACSLEASQAEQTEKEWRLYTENL